jgi:hypothetical protein
MVTVLRAGFLKLFVGIHKTAATNFYCICVSHYSCNEAVVL